jgi:hypothetical protein
VSNPNKEKGDRWERAVRAYLSDTFGRLVRRPHAEGRDDVGDIHLDPFVLQCKDEAAHRFSSYVRDAEKQAGHADQPYGVAVVKQRGKGAADGYVVMSLRTFRAVAERLDAAEGAEAALLGQGA